MEQPKRLHTKGRGIDGLLYLPECREILWFSYGSAAAAGYGGGSGDYGEISTFVTCEKKKISLVCWSVCLSKRLSVGPICENPEGPLFLPEFVCVSVCVSVDGTSTS